LFAPDAPHETPSIAPQALATRSKSLFVVPCQQATTARDSPSRILAESSRNTCDFAFRKADWVQVRAAGE
jgi:hypothetical protein